GARRPPERLAADAVDAAVARDADGVRARHHPIGHAGLGDQPVHVLVLGGQRHRAPVEPVAVALGAGHPAADPAVGLQHGDLVAPPDQAERGGQPGDPGADDDHPPHRTSPPISRRARTLVSEALYKTEGKGSGSRTPTNRGLAYCSMWANLW